MPRQAKEKAVVEAIDRILDDWRADPDMLPETQALIMIEALVDRNYNRPERNHFKD